MITTVRKHLRDTKNLDFTMKKPKAPIDLTQDVHAKSLALKYFPVHQNQTEFLKSLASYTFAMYGKGLFLMSQATYILPEHIESFPVFAEVKRDLLAALNSYNPQGQMVVVEPDEKDKSILTIQVIDF